MARSKAFMFEEDEINSCKLFFAMAHPARFRMMGRLLRTAGPLSYPELSDGIPLVDSSVSRHLRIMEREGFIVPQLLADGNAGYVLNKKFYLACTAASRRGLRGNAAVVAIRDGDVEADEVG